MMVQAYNFRTQAEAGESVWGPVLNDCKVENFIVLILKATVGCWGIGEST